MPPDPPTPIDPATTAAPDATGWETYNQVLSQTVTMSESVSGVSGKMQLVFGALESGVAKLGTSFASLDRMTSEQAAGFGALSSAILGSKEAFTSLSSDIDTSRMTTMMGAVKELEETFRNSPMAELAKKQFDKARKSIMGDLGSGKITKELAGSLLGGAQKVFDEATTLISASGKAMLTSADNAHRLETAMMTLTQQAGDYKELMHGIPGLMRGVGAGFENIGEVMQKVYTKSIERGTAALGGNRELAAKYVAEINRMPGGFKALATSMEIAGTKTDVLTASIEYARGAMRKQEDVFSDMSKAMAEYGVSGGDALKFSSRMTEVSRSTGGQIKDIQSALHSAADSFKTYVNDGANASKMTQGMADSMRSYVSELKSVGVPAQNAIEMFKNYSSQLNSMTIGQQSFLSTMGGGPGGLRGALQVQDDLAKGNFEKIKKQVEQTLRKTSGPLITREEGMKSEAGAAQYVRQMQVLQQGPLGSMAKTPGEADSLIRAMKSGKAFKPEEGKTPEVALKETMKEGQQWQKGSYTFLHEINKDIAAMRNIQERSNLGTAQQMFTAAGARALPGRSGAGSGISPDSQERLMAQQRVISTPTSSPETFKHMSEVIKDLPKTLNDAWKSFQGAIGTGKKEDIQQANDKMLAAIKEAQNTGMTEKQRSSLDTVQQAFSVTKPENTPSGPTIGPTGAAVPKMVFTPITRPGQIMPKPMSPPAATGAAGTPAVGRQAPGVGGGASGQAVPVTLAPGSAITVNFTGACPHCGTNVRHATESQISPQSGAK